jgi:hypothetical protein
MRNHEDSAKKRWCLDLEALTTYCQPEKAKVMLWPSGELLQSLEDGVRFFTAEERKAPLSWKTFQRLDKRLPKLRLVLRVDNLVKRARGRLKEAGQPALSELKRQAQRGDEDAQRLLRDIAAISGIQVAQKNIDWTQHERALAQFSRTNTVEPSYGRSAPVEFRCYARTLELLVDDYRRKPMRIQAMPLLEWVAKIGHPDAKNLVAFDYAAECEIERRARASQEHKALQRREKGRERTRRHREFYRGKFVYPGDWLLFSDAADFKAYWGRKQPLPETCVGLYDSECRDDLNACLDSLSCCRKLADQTDGFYYHGTRHVGRCCDCQNAEWIAQGFEVENGFPYGDWTLTTAERIAEQKRHLREEMERERRWLQTATGQQWLRETNRRFVASLKEKARQKGWTKEQLREEAKAYGLI